LFNDAKYLQDVATLLYDRLDITFSDCGDNFVTFYSLRNDQSTQYEHVIRRVKYVTERMTTDWKTGVRLQAMIKYPSYRAYKPSFCNRSGQTLCSNCLVWHLKVMLSPYLHAGDKGTMGIPRTHS
jgi:hypothetical protein